MNCVMYAYCGELPNYRNTNTSACNLMSTPSVGYGVVSSCETFWARSGDIAPFYSQEAGTSCRISACIFRVISARKGSSVSSILLLGVLLSSPPVTRVTRYLGCVGRSMSACV